MSGPRDDARPVFMIGIAAEMAGPSANRAEVEQIRAQLGLNQPPLERMASWYGGLLRGDLGKSILLNHSVGSAILERLPVTLSLAGIALLVVAAIVGLLVWIF